jgi:hypothetical protein
MLMGDSRVRVVRKYMLDLAGSAVHTVNSSYGSTISSRLLETKRKAPCHRAYDWRLESHKHLPRRGYRSKQQQSPPICPNYSNINTAGAFSSLKETSRLGGPDRHLVIVACTSLPRAVVSLVTANLHCSHGATHLALFWALKPVGVELFCARNALADEGP